MKVLDASFPNKFLHGGFFFRKMTKTTSPKTTAKIT